MPVCRNVDGPIYYGDLVTGQSMDGFCRSLQEKGAIFYTEIQDSPEVIEFELLDAETALKKELAHDSHYSFCT
jgi:hypothetical protein